MNLKMVLEIHVIIGSDSAKPSRADFRQGRFSGPIRQTSQSSSR